MPNDPNTIDEQVKNKRRLESHQDVLKWWLDGFTALVVLGLIIEYLPDLVKAFHPPHLLGGLLITVGVAGELAIGVLSSRTETKVREINDSIIANIRLDAAAAEERAAEANARAAKLEIEALQLRKQLQSQGPRANLITGEARKRLVDALKPFTKQPVDVRHCATVIGINRRIATVTPIGDDVVGLASSLIDVLKEADWDVPSKPMPSTLQGEGIAVQVGVKASGRTKAAAQALVEALRRIPLAVEDPSDEHGEPWRRRPSDDPIEPPFGDDTIVIDVLPRP
jgi:hypothetical protein